MHFESTSVHVSSGILVSFLGRVVLARRRAFRSNIVMIYVFWKTQIDYL